MPKNCTFISFEILFSFARNDSLSRADFIFLDPLKKKQVFCTNAKNYWHPLPLLLSFYQILFLICYGWNHSSDELKILWGLTASKINESNCVTIKVWVSLPLSRHILHLGKQVRDSNPKFLDDYLPNSQPTTKISICLKIFLHTKNHCRRGNLGLNQISSDQYRV